MAARRKRPSKRPDTPVKVRDFPLAVRLVIDALMLRSTVPTAIAYGVAWSVVAASILWNCDRLAFMGLRSPAVLVRQETRQQIQWMLGNDVSFYYASLCRLPDGILREQMSEHYVRLQMEYKYLAGTEASVQPCPPR